jgi:hypothetical protein
MKRTGAHAGEGASPYSATKVSRGRTARSFVFSILAVIALILIDDAKSRSAVPESSSPESILRVLSQDYVYEHLLGSPKPPSKFVAVIMLYRDMPEPSSASGSESAQFATACQRRTYLAQVLTALAATRPKAVVLDMWFEPNFCSDTDSQPLWTAVDALAKQIPVVSGIGAFDPDEATANWPAELSAASRRGAELKPTELVAMPAIPLAHSIGEAVTEASVELDADNRKIPLSWPVYASFAAIGRSGEPRRIDSLAVAAVRAIDPNNPALKRVGALDINNAATPSGDPHPYTTFLREEDLPIVRADDVLCASAAQSKDCGTSRGAIIDTKTLFSGRVVLIGSAGFGNDAHQSLIGYVPGVVLQANYVESLLQNRVYVPMGFVGQLLLFGGWIGIGVWGPRLIAGRIRRLVAYGAAIVLPILLLHFYIIYSGYYMPFLVKMMVGVAVFFVARKIDEFVVEGEREP